MNNNTSDKYRQMCIEMWEWISNQPDNTNKAEYFVANEFNNPPMETCFACEYDEILFNKDPCASLCENCPIVWGEGMQCEDNGSPYDSWNKNKTKQAAKIFLDFIKERWPTSTGSAV